MTNREISDFIGAARELCDKLAAFQQVQANLLRAHADPKTQFLYDINSIETKNFYWQLSDVLRSALAEAEVRAAAR